jgi:hypothetical protein
VSGRAVADNGGELEHLELHYTLTAGEILIPTYAALLQALPAGIAISVVVEEQSAFDDLVRRLLAHGVVRDGLRPVVTGYAITPWSRDRFTLVEGSDGQSYLIVPSAADGGVAERFNDWMVPWSLAAQDSRTHVVTIPLRFDGGDLLVTEDYLFASYRLVEKNLGTVVASRAEVVEILESVFGREVFLFGESPTDVPIHHVGMYLAPLPDGRMLVGDPELAVDLIGREQAIELGADLSDENIARFHNVARAFEAAGFEVVPMPVLPLMGGLDYVTYSNLVMEVRDGETAAWVPTYGIAELDAWALNRFSELGVRAVGIDVSAVYRYNGSVRCLVNVLARG